MNKGSHCLPSPKHYGGRREAPCLIYWTGLVTILCSVPVPSAPPWHGIGCLGVDRCHASAAVRPIAPYLLLLPYFLIELTDHFILSNSHGNYPPPGLQHLEHWHEGRGRHKTPSSIRPRQEAQKYLFPSLPTCYGVFPLLLHVPARRHGHCPSPDSTAQCQPASNSIIPPIYLPALQSLAAPALVYQCNVGLRGLITYLPPLQ